jgi:hypothetical protein
MLSAHCPRHGRTVLVPTSAIDGIDNTQAGIVVRWHCTCGHPGTTRFPRRHLPPRPRHD